MDLDLLDSHAYRRSQVAQRHGFSFVPVDQDNIVVEMFRRAECRALGIPENTPAKGQMWYAATKGEGVYLIFGLSVDTDGAISVPDFYAYPGRLGTLATYAALYKIKEIADKAGQPVVGFMPKDNVRMKRACQRVFGVPGPLPVDVYRYVPCAVKWEKSA